MSEREILVEINGRNVPLVIYRGQRVITLAQVDALHERPTGTARRNFNEHKAKLIPKEDYFVVADPEEIRRVAYEIRMPRGKKSLAQIRAALKLIARVVRSIDQELQRRGGAKC